MHKSNNNLYRGLWTSVIVLFICVAATTFALMDRLDGFQPDDSGAIPLIGSNTPDEQDTVNQSDATQSTEQFDTAQKERTVQSENFASAGTSTETHVAQLTRNPDSETSDESIVWTTNTQVEIFRISYENGEQSITVKSDNGEAVIAPGTSNSYTFKLKNTGDVALDYTVTLDAYFAPGDAAIPVSCRLGRYDGRWVVGNSESYADAAALDAAQDQATLGAGKYVYYTLDWLWPFESGNDEMDTMLGNLAEEQDLTFTIVIKTTGTESADPHADSGITPPKTGDTGKPELWIAIAVGAFFLILILIFYKRRTEAEAKDGF